MTRLVNCGIEINIPKAEIEFYIRAGYQIIEEPVEIPAPEVELAISNLQKPENPDEVAEKPKVRGRKAKDK